MTVSPIQASPAPYFPQQAATQSTDAVLNSDFQTFLQMLTAQMKNQDPLNPIESSDFAAQLAAFSTVEQQVMTNGLLEDMSAMLGLGGLAEASGWVGQEVRSEAPAHFHGAPVDLAVAPAPQADQSILEVYDVSGTLVQELELSRDDTLISWAGVNDDGAPLPEGEYTFVVDNRIDGESIGLTAVNSYNEVVEARSENGQIFLVLGSGRAIPADSISGIRA